MKNIYLSIKIYIGLIVTLAILAAINVFLPQGSFSTVLLEQELPASKSVLTFVNATVMLILYGGLEFVGLKLSQRLDFADIWDPKVFSRQRFLPPALTGTVIGIFFILADAILSRFHTLGRFLIRRFQPPLSPWLLQILAKN